MKKLTILFTSACALTISNNSFGMEKQPQDPNVSCDTVALLQENNKLLREIKRQNRAIIKQNFLNFKHHTLHTQLCSSEFMMKPYNLETSLNEKYKLQTKIKEIYLTERLTDKSWSSDEDDILYSK